MQIFGQKSAIFLHFAKCTLQNRGILGIFGQKSVFLAHFTRFQPLIACFYAIFKGIFANNTQKSAVFTHNYATGTHFYATCARFYANQHEIMLFSRSNVPEIAKTGTLTPVNRYKVAILGTFVLLF